MNLREELASIDEQLGILDAKRRDVYRRSIAARDAEKICENSLAALIAEPDVGSFRYPVTVGGIHFEGTLVENLRGKANRLVRIRPCAAEYAGKTFLGLYLGELARSVGCSYDRESTVLGIYLGGHNPAIWVPSLARIIFGCESWWAVVESEAQLQEISDETIDGIWYLQALKALWGAAESSETA